MSTCRRLCRLGSTSGGAGSPNGLTEGVSKVEWGKPTILHSLCRGRLSVDPKLTQLSASLNGIIEKFLSSWLSPGKLDFLTSGTSELIDKKA